MHCFRESGEEVLNLHRLGQARNPGQPRGLVNGGFVIGCGNEDDRDTLTARSEQRRHVEATLSAEHDVGENARAGRERKRTNQLIHVPRPVRINSGDS
jgi:hypothetical protein